MADQGFLADKMKGFFNMTLLKQYGFTILLIFVLPLSGCATSTTFRVLDAETKQPIEGAVALAEWTSTGGLPGLSHTSTAKVAEDVSDSEGNLSIPRAWGFLALQTPHIKIYKPGYVGWDSKLIYLGYYKNDIKSANLVKRKDFSMKNQDIFLVPWNDEKHSYISHYDLIMENVDFTDVGIRGDNSLYRKAIDYEIPFRVKERDLLP